MKKEHRLIGIAAVSENGVIGQGNALPWHIPEDLAWFKSTTLGHALVMGRATYNSIGKPLPGRKTYILTRSPSGPMDICSISQATSESGILFLCGGAEVYAQFLFECDELLITHVKRESQGDKYLPYFKHKFYPVETICTKSEYDIIRYERNQE